VQRELARRPGATAETVLDLSRSLIDVGYSEEEIGDSAAAMQSFKEAQKRAEELEASGRGSDNARFVLATALWYQSEVLDLSSKPAEAKALNDRSTAILQALVDMNPGVVDFQKMLAKALRIERALSPTLVEALAAFGRELKIAEKLAEARPDAWNSSRHRRSERRRL
jgi:hypothetical protein